MPILEQDTIRNSLVTVESRKIKIGQKSGKNLPEKLSGFIITKTIKPKGGKNFERDEYLMRLIWEQMGQPIKEKAPVPELPRIPVTLLSDDVADIVHVYRGWYAASGPRCTSVLGNENAIQRYDKKDGELVKLDKPKDRVCDRTCPMWKENGEKSDCGWHGVVSVQIRPLAIIPNLSKFRTTGWNTIQHLMGSLNQIKKITGDILAGIPLDMVWHEVEGRTKKENKTRKYPVVSFEFVGSPQELRAAAIIEATSRMQLAAAKNGESVTGITMPAVSMNAGASMPLAVGGDLTDAVQEEDDELLIDDDDEGDDAPPPAGDPPSKEEDKEADALVAKMKALAESAGVVERGLDLMIDKHDGDIAAVVAELEKVQRKPAPEPEKKAAPEPESEPDDNDRGDTASTAGMSEAGSDPAVSTVDASSNFSAGEATGDDDYFVDDDDIDGDKPAVSAKDDSSSEESSPESTEEPPEGDGDLFDDNEDWVFEDEGV